METKSLHLDPEMEPIECLDGPGGCSGKVEYRMPLSGTGRSFPRCDKHWRERLDVQERINRDYPTVRARLVGLIRLTLVSIGTRRCR